jgi:hypothetical protein
LGERGGKIVNAKEERELSKLSKKWVLGKATMKEMARCLVLSRKVKAEGGK